MKVKASWVIDESVDDPVRWMDSHHVFFLQIYGRRTKFKKAMQPMMVYT